MSDHDPHHEGRDDAATPMSPRPARARGWIGWAKAVVTVAILAYLLTKIDLSLSLRLIGESHLGWLAAAFTFNSLALITSSVKWDRLLRAVGVHSSHWKVLELYTIGFFASSFLPGVVGGDVVRWQLAGKRHGLRLKVAATILIERITGVAALVIVSILAVAASPRELATPPVLLLLAGMTAALVAGLAVALNRRMATVLAMRARRSRIARPVKLLYRLHRTMRTFPARPLAVAMAWSFAFYASVGGVFYLIALALDAPVGLHEAATVQILICLLTLIPISLGGLGLAQAGDVYLLGLYGVSPERALALSIMRQLIAYGYVAIGGFLFVRWRARPEEQAIPGREDGVAEAGHGT